MSWVAAIVNFGFLYFSRMIVKFAECSMCICSGLENVRVDARIDSIPLLTIAWCESVTLSL